MIFDTTIGDFSEWRIALQKLTGNFSSRHTLLTKENLIIRYLNNCLKQGVLRMRPSKTEDIWNERYCILTQEALVVLENAHSTSDILLTYHLHPCCSVYETNLGQFAFCLVTPEMVLHVSSDSKISSVRWITQLREAIEHSPLDSRDPLWKAALAKVNDHVYYDVEFVDERPLGVVLERAREWMIVKQSNVPNVYLGSVLMAVNNVDVSLLTYEHTLDKIKMWKPPLKLRFLRAPRKTGYLCYRSVFAGRLVWNKRWFILEGRSFQYKRNDTQEADVLEEVPLMGSAVSLVPESATGKLYCFQFLHGLTCWTVRAASAPEMMEWAAALYHAVDIANGGGLTLNVFRRNASSKQKFPFGPNRAKGADDGEAEAAGIHPQDGTDRGVDLPGMPLSSLPSLL